MSEGKAGRRSGRRRTTNPRYVDNVKDLDLGTSDSEEVLSLPNADDSEDIDFDEEAAQEAEEEDDDVEAESDGVPGLIEDLREADNDADRLEPLPKVPDVSRKRPLEAGEQTPLRTKTRSRRGLKNIPRRLTRRVRIEQAFGRADEDLIPYLKNRDTWQNDFTLPSNFAPSSYHTEQMREKESTKGWKWYVSNGGSDAFSKYQKMQNIEEEAARQYLANGCSKEQHFVMGPLKEQRVFTLKTGGSMPLSAASPTSVEKPGYLLNVGAKVQNVDWLSNNDSAEQYLAISTLKQEPHSRSQPPEAKLNNASPPAFTPSPPYPTSIQVWSLSKQLAALHTVLCFDWGDPKQIRWCPMPGPANDCSPRGLLAGVFFDGSIRVFDITLQASPGPHYLHIISTAVKFVLPQGVLPTSVTWLSTESLAVGSSNGNVAIFNLAEHLRTGTDPETNPPRPWLYHPIHTTYILSLTSCYPSRPHLLLTTSLDGSIRLTDLRNPITDTITNPRSRVGASALAWHDRIQSAVSVDELGVVKANTIRRFFQMTELCKLPAQAGDVRTSPLHGSILTGGLDGRAYVSGPMKRIINANKAEVWRQCWFEFSWRRGLDARQVEVLKADRRARRQQIRAAEAADRQDGGGDGGEESQMMEVDEEDDGNEDLARLRLPMSRFLDGHKPEQVLGPGVDTHKHSLTYHTVYEEQSAITQVAWNPNISYGGWAAAGTGSGLVRIEDLTLRRTEVNERKAREGRKS